MAPPTVSSDLDLCPKLKNLIIAKHTLKHMIPECRPVNKQQGIGS